MMMTLFIFKHSPYRHNFIKCVYFYVKLTMSHTAFYKLILAFLHPPSTIPFFFPYTELCYAILLLHKWEKSLLSRWMLTADSISVSLHPWPDSLTLDTICTIMSQLPPQSSTLQLPEHMILSLVTTVEYYDEAEKG